MNRIAERIKQIDEPMLYCVKFIKKYNPDICGLLVFDNEKSANQLLRYCQVINNCATACSNLGSTDEEYDQDGGIVDNDEKVASEINYYNDQFDFGLIKVNQLCKASILKLHKSNSKTMEYKLHMVVNKQKYKVNILNRSNPIGIFI